MHKMLHFLKFAPPYIYRYIHMWGVTKTMYIGSLSRILRHISDQANPQCFTFYSLFILLVKINLFCDFYPVWPRKYE